MAIEQQMEMFGANPMGGLDDDGMSRDPVSGNEIPPGSMANEVRDDVDAKLSDGEYVVPANVVRFFGVKFFEDLRTQAMQGLGAMEANGRIGGEPMPSDMPMQDQMAGVSEADMQMLQSMMNEGGYVQGYVHGGLHEAPDYASTAYNPDQYPLTSTYGTVGGSYFNSLLNPNAPVDPNEPPVTTMPVTPSPESGISFVTMVNPATGEIQMVQFMGGNPVDEGAYNQLLSNGFFIQGSPELAAYKQEANRDPEQDYDITTGSKPFNKMTVGELAWTMSRQSYNGAFPDSLSAGAAKLFGMSGISKIAGGVLGNIPSELKIAISEASQRLKNNEFSNAAEKAALEIMAGLDPTKPKEVYKAIYDLTGTHLGASGKGYKRDIRVKDFSKDVMVDDLNATSLLGNRYTSSSEALKDAGADTMRVAGDIREQEETKREDALESIKKIQDAAEDNNQTVADYYQENRDKAEEDRQEYTQQKEAIQQEQQANVSATGSSSRPNNSAAAYSGSVQGKEFGRAKGGLIKKPKKKKSKKY